MDDETHDDLEENNAVQQVLGRPRSYSVASGAVEVSSPHKSHQSNPSQTSHKSYHCQYSNSNHGTGSGPHPQLYLFNHPGAHSAPKVSHSSSSNPLPPFIKRLPGHITQRDLEYLADKDALTIPDKEFRDELLRTYVKIVYCFIPALELDNFLDPIINGGNDSKPVSLLLFQAVMFASVVFVDSSLLTARGYPSRKVARKAFFNRVRLLYELDCEPDRMALIQSLLLMTFWYDSPDDEKDTWYWMGITLSLAQVMGLHRDPVAMNISQSEKRLRRRIWWSCFIRDRLLALGIRRPARIRTEDFNVPMLELADYDLGQPVQERIVFVRESGFTSIEDDGRRQMCQMCIDLAKLCVVVGNILQTQYSIVGTNSEGLKNMAVLPKQSKAQMADLVKCDSELEDWRRNQPAMSKYTPRSPSARSGQRKDDYAEDIIWLHQSLLYMVYLTAIGALHRPRALMSPPPWMNASEANSARKGSLAKVKEAAITITRIAFDLQSENHLRYLWTSSIPAFLSATLIHLLDIHDPEEQVRNMSLGRFYQCYHALCELQDMYTSAEYALRFLEKFLIKSGTHIPMLQSFKPSSVATAVTRAPSASNSSHRWIPSPAEPRQAKRSYSQSSMPPPADNSLTGAAVPYNGDFRNSRQSHSPSISQPNRSHISPSLPPPPPPLPLAAGRDQQTPQFSGNGQMTVGYNPNQPSFMQLFSAEAGDHESLLHDHTNGSPMFGDHSAGNNAFNLSLGPLSNLTGTTATGNHTLIETPPSHVDVWGEFDGLLFTLADFDGTESCSMIQQNQDMAMSSAGMPTETTTVGT